MHKIIALVCQPRSHRISLSDSFTRFHSNVCHFVCHTRHGVSRMSIIMSSLCCYRKKPNENDNGDFSVYLLDRRALNHVKWSVFGAASLSLLLLTGDRMSLAAALSRIIIIFLLFDMACARFVMYALYAFTSITSEMHDFKRARTANRQQTSLMECTSIA